MASSRLYDIIGVDVTASHDDIKRAYKRLAMKHHPDKEGGDGCKFKEINEAYAILGDEESRNRHDVSFHPRPDPIIDHMSQMFGGMGMFMNMHMHTNTPMKMPSKPDNHVHVLDTSLEEAFTGIVKTIHVTVKKQCPRCVVSKPCSGCEGTGVYRQTHSIGIIRHVVTVTCAACGGQGTAHVSCIPGGVSCDTCKNTRVHNTDHVLTVFVPPGANSGHREVFTGLGAQGQAPGEKPGDLIVEVKVHDHPCFTRQGDDLFMNVCISLWESIIGKDLVVPMFGGDLLFNTYDMDTGIMQAGKRYVLANHGMPMCGGARGALVLSFTIAYPMQRMDAADHVRLVLALNERHGMQGMQGMHGIQIS